MSSDPGEASDDLEDSTSIEEPANAEIFTSSEEISALISYTEAALTALEDANLETFKHTIRRLNKDVEDVDFLQAVVDVERLFGRLNNQHVSILKHALQLSTKWEPKTLDLYALRERMNTALKSLNLTMDLWDIKQFVELFASLCFYIHKITKPFSGEMRKPEILLSETDTDFLPKRIQDLNWAESWKLAVKGVLQKQRRERIRDKALTKMEAYTRRTIPKSEATKEHLRKILSASFLFGDLEASLRDEIVDAFEDIRVKAGQNIIKQGDPADNFYVIVSLERTLESLIFSSQRDEKHLCW